MNKIDEPVILLAGGFGTRLRSVVADVPKPLAPVAGRTFLDFLLDSLMEEGAQRVIVSLHYMADYAIEYLSKNKSRWSFDLEFCVEEKPLGTGGAIRFVAEKAAISGSAWVFNADTWMENGLKNMNRSIPSELRSANWLGVRHVNNASRYGRVIFDPNNRVLSFEEKKAGDEPGWIYAGISLLNINSLKETEMKVFSVENHHFPKLRDAGTLYASPLAGDFIDIGTPEDYERFKVLAQEKFR